MILCCFSSQQIRPYAWGSFCKTLQEVSHPREFSPHSRSSFVMLQNPPSSTTPNPWGCFCLPNHSHLLV